MNRSALIVAAGVAVTVVALAACSSSSGDPTASAESSSASASGSPASAGAAPGTGAQRFGPAVSGVIAAISGHTLQVQSTSQQNAVTYSGTTRFTRQEQSSLSAIKVGTCISATAKPSSDPTTGGRGTQPAHITASRVDVLGTTCTFRARPGAASGVPSRPGGFGPSGAASGLPSDAPGRSRLGFAARVFGKVTKVSGPMITVDSGGAPGSATTRTVLVTPATRYSTTASATSKALKVGLCASVQGTTGSTGTVAARSISLSQKTGGTCSTSFGFGGFAGRRGGGAGG